MVSYLTHFYFEMDKVLRVLSAICQYFVDLFIFHCLIELRKGTFLLFLESYISAII